MKALISIFSLLIVMSTSFQILNAQDHHEHEDHGSFEVGIGGGMAYSPYEKALYPAAHLHLIGKMNDWLGAGLGYELILADHVHQGVGIMLDLTPTEWLSMDFGPSLVFPDSEHPGFKLAFHSELALIHHFKGVHLGPLIDLGLMTGDLHIGAGLHLGFDLK